MTREPIEVTRQDRIYCLKASSDYHSEVCEECKFYPNCDHMTQDDMTELTIKDLEALEQKPKTGHWVRWYEEIQRGTHYTEDIPHCKCSECNKEYDPYVSRFIKYCSQCGAKMIE